MDEASIEREALKILGGLSEDQLRDEIVAPLFRHKGLKVEVIDENREVSHGCDLLLESDGQGERTLVGVQLKARENITTRSYVKKNIQRCARDGFAFRFGRDGRGRLARFRWITTGRISEIGSTYLYEELEKDADLGGRVEVWDLGTLYRELRSSGAMGEIGALKILDAKLRAEEHRKNNEGVFAAHYWQRIGRWCLTQKNRDPAAAKEAFDQAAALLKGDPHQSRYYYRALVRYSEMWSLLADRWYELSPNADDHLVDIAQSAAAKAILTERYPEGLIPLLQDAESIFLQLEIIQDLYDVDYASFEMLQITRLLLRAGFPTSLSSLKRRFAHIDGQLAEEGGSSIDNECSLCTSCAASCYSLANRSATVAPAMEWLKSLKRFRYCHLISAPRNPAAHALHYAAMVLVAFLDYGGPEENLADVLTVFFSSPVQDSRGFLQEWLRFGNEDRFWTYKHIFSGFLRFVLSGRTIDEGKVGVLKKGLAVLVASLREEAQEAEAFPDFYSIRENLGSFAYGLTVGSAESAELATAVITILRTRAAETLRSQKKGRQELWDSSIRRTQTFIEGFLQYWETILYLEEQDEM